MPPFHSDNRLYRILCVGAIFLSLMLVSAFPALAQVPARETYFTTSVVYQNISAATASTGTVYYYRPSRVIPSGSPTPTPVALALPTLGPLGSGSRYMGDLYFKTKNSRGSGRLNSG